MKLRIYRDSVRLRLNETEVARFAAAGSVCDTIDFGPGLRFSYTLESSRSAERLHVSYSPDSLRILVPSEVAEKWSHSDQVGITSEGSSPSLLVEKDFRCIHREPGEEDDAASYPNPLESTL